MALAVEGLGTRAAEALGQLRRLRFEYWKAEMRGGERSTSIKQGEVRNPRGKNQYVPGAAAAAKKIIADVKELAKELTPKAMKALEAVLDSATAPPAAKVSAATVILDRGWGKPQQDVSVTQTFDVADRNTQRWRENLARLNAEEPLTIEGEKVDVTPK